jgi:hypothetical protein
MISLTIWLKEKDKGVSEFVEMIKGITSTNLSVHQTFNKIISL